MNRKKFLIAAGAATTVALISIPIFKSKLKRTWKDNPLQSPESLSYFCDAEMINKIGMAYRSQVPAENSQEKLKAILLTDASGKTLDEKSKSKIAAAIEKRVKSEFDNYQTLILEGWVVSPTEARQCALYTFGKVQA